MVSFRESPVDEPRAHALVAEYFAMRENTFPPELGDYTPKYPTPADFVPPHGVFLVVVDEGQDIGCGGVRALDAHRFELKHLYIRPQARGHGLGRQLLTELENRASAFGATEFVLDTNASLVAAGNLYRSSGYRNIERYNDHPNATDWFHKTVE
jgi:GNAT superfamily N-acetyltransferase